MMLFVALARKDKRWILKVFFSYIILLFIFSLIGDHGLIASWRLWREGVRTDLEISKLQEDIQQLRVDVDQFRHSDKRLEQYAREKLNLSGENEVQFIFK